ncbi:MAG TPA: hypothetical protein VID29_07985, partial [Solirubrobacteraceae bacterium]
MAIQTTANPAEAKSSNLFDVSCKTTEACVSVGSDTLATGSTVTLAGSWNGKEWSIQTTPNPTEAKSSILSGVSCATAESCIAVGRYINSLGATVTLAESWSGKEWATQT